MSLRPDSQVRRAVGVFVLLVGSYLTTSSFRVDSIDAAIRLEVARSLAHGGTVAVERIQLPTPFGPVGTFLGRGDRYYSVYGLGQSLLMVPLVLAGGAHGEQLVTIINLFAVALACTLLVLLGRRLGYSARASTRLGLICGLCTLLWPHAKLAFEAPIEMLCAVGAIYLLERRSRSGDFGAGAVFGFAVLTRPSALLMLAGLAWLLLRDGKRWRLGRLPHFAIGAAPLLILALGYNFVRWGSVIGSGYSRTGYQYFGWPSVGLPGLLLSPGRGFFTYSPVLILALWGFLRFARSHRGFAQALLLIVGSYFAFHSFLTTWDGDWTWGPRHLLPVVPLVALGMLPLLEPERMRRSILVALIGISVVVQLPGLSVSYDSYFHWLPSHGYVEASSRRHHFEPRAAQIPVQFVQAVTMWRELPERLDRFSPRRAGDPYRPRLAEASAVTREVPDLWWIYFPLIGVSWSAFAGLSTLCVLLMAAGVWLLRDPRGHMSSAP